MSNIIDNKTTTELKNFMFTTELIPNRWIQFETNIFWAIRFYCDQMSFANSLLKLVRQHRNERLRLGGFRNVYKRIETYYCESLIQIHWNWIICVASKFMHSILFRKWYFIISIGSLFWGSFFYDSSHTPESFLEDSPKYLLKRS